MSERGYRMLLHGLEADALIGVYAHERERPQRVLIDLDLWLRYGGPGLDDRFDQVLDYEELAARVRRLTGAEHTNLVETLADRIAALCLTDHRVARVRVRVVKPGVLDRVAAVGVEVERTAEPQDSSGRA
jgi:7,8-dihydroneopterin aldolase/epimerase/oxygenase